MELNDTTDYQLCFACGQRNPYGIHMVFRQEGDSIVCDFMPHAEHQGFPGIIHGGIVASVLDEALNRTSMLGNPPAWTMTGRLEVRYRRNVPYGPMLRVRAKLNTQRGRLLTATGAITLAENEAMVLAEAQGTFMALTQDMQDTIMQEYPVMHDFFKRES